MGFGGASQSNPLIQYQMMFNTLAGGRQQQAYTDEAGRIREQANIIADESERAAIARQREVRQFAGQQAESYLAGGVLLAGTPLAVLEETRQQGQQEIDAIRSAGAAKAKLLRLQADQTERTGLDSLLNSQAQNLFAKAQSDQEERAAKARRRRDLLGGAFSIGKLLLS